MIVLIGESASGKSTIEKELMKKGYKKIVSYTTRPIRTRETDGIDYYYISVEDFQNKLDNNFFAEYTIYNGWYYGIAVNDCVNNAVVVVEPHGFRQLKNIDNLHITSFYIKVKERERLIRMVKRGDNLLEVFRRIFSDQGVFQFIENEVNYTIENNNINTAVNKILNYLEDVNE